MADKSDERWDIYDSDRRLTGRTMQRNDWHMQPGDFHVTVLGVIRNSEGKYLVTKRAMTKSYAPGSYEVPGGGVMAGETSLEAMRREMFEETGIDISSAEGELCFTYCRENPSEGDNYFVDVYRFYMDVDESSIMLEDEETSEFALLTHDEIIAIADEGKFLHYNSIKKVFE